MRIVFVDNLLLEDANGSTQYVLQPHLGLISLIAVAETAGHVGVLYDPKLALARGMLTLSESLYFDAAKQILDLCPDVVGMTSLGCNFICTVKIAAYLKRLQPELPIMLGGPHATVLDREIVSNFPQFDVVVRNEAELKLLAVLEAIPKRSFFGVPGVTFFRKNTVWSNPGDPIIEDLDALPRPAYHSYPVRELGLRSLRVDAGRGCPFACTFCSTASFFGRKYRLKSAERLSEELDFLHSEYGVTDFALTHDLFTVNRRKVVEFCEAVKGRGYTWKCSARMDCVDENLIQRMVESGCRSIYYGVEAGSERMQEISKKRLDLSLFKSTLDFTQTAGMSATVSFITGYPQENRQDQDATLDLMSSCFGRAGTPLNVQLHLLTPEPGTQLLNEFGHGLAFDGHVSDFNFPTLEADDAEVMASKPSIFVNHHYFPTELPRQQNIFVTATYQTLYTLGFSVLDYLLQFYDRKLSFLFADLYDWASENDATNLPAATVILRYIEEKWGDQHCLLSLVKYMLAASNLRGNLANTSCLTSNADKLLVEWQARRLSEHQPRQMVGTYVLSPSCAVVRDIHNCPNILDRLAKRNSVQVRLPMPVRTKTMTFLIMLENAKCAEVTNFVISDAVATTMEYFGKNRSEAEYVTCFSSQTGLPYPSKAFFAKLLRLGVLIERFDESHAEIAVES